jgi:hypothetical protein
MRVYLFWLATGVLGACSSADATGPAAPRAPRRGQLAVSFPMKSLHAGTNALYFAVVSYDGSRSPQAIDRPLQCAEVTVRLLDGDTPSEVSASAHFLANGPEFMPAEGTSQRANYWAQLDLPRAGAGVIEFWVVNDGEGRRIQAPLAVRVREGEGTPAF